MRTMTMIIINRIRTFQPARDKSIRTTTYSGTDLEDGLESYCQMPVRI